MGGRVAVSCEVPYQGHLPNDDRECHLSAANNTVVSTRIVVEYLGHSTDFEERQVIIWLSVVSGACEDFNSSTLQLEAQESFGDIADTSAMSHPPQVVFFLSLHHLVLCTHTVGRVVRKVHPH